MSTIDTVIAEALEVLKRGGVILYPTDTVWGIGCDATNEEAVAKVFEIKRRSGAKSLVLLASDLDMVAKHIKVIPSIAIDLVEVNDAPMTIIYPGAQYLAPNVVAEDGSVGIRIPQNEFCVQLVRKLRRPLVSTSANISGEETPALRRFRMRLCRPWIMWCRLTSKRTPPGGLRRLSSSACAERWKSSVHRWNSSTHIRFRMASRSWMRRSPGTASACSGTGSGMPSRSLTGAGPCCIAS